MRVLLVYPPLLPNGQVLPPVGLSTLASFLIPEHQTSVLDLDLELKLNSQHKPYLDIFAQTLSAFDPDVVCVTSMYSNSLHAERLIKHAKLLAPNVVTVAGGPHFGAIGKLALQRIPQLDFVISGEGETALARLLNVLDDSTDAVEHVPSLCYRRNGAIVQNERGPLLDLLTSIPIWPRLGRIHDLRRYSRTISANSDNRIFYLEAGRGCPFRCTFCATAPFWEHKYRVKPISVLIAELQYLHEELHYDSFILIHDLLTVDREFVGAFSDAVFDTRMPIQWMANSRTDISLDGVLPKMRASGCWKLFLGIESASPRLQTAITKKLDPPSVVEAISRLVDHGIAATASFVIGFPDETRAELSQSIAMAARLKMMATETVQFHRLRLWPPAPLTRENFNSVFDYESAKIEYPFINVPAEDLSIIEDDPQFFSGYFVPESCAGTAPQLIQVEMFFHHAIALAPLTISALAELAQLRLIDAFYEAIEMTSPLRREQLDWELGHLTDNWSAISPLLGALIEVITSPRDCERLIVSEILRYESLRLKFICGQSMDDVETVANGSNWVALSMDVDVPLAISYARSGKAMIPGILRPTIVILVRKSDGECAFYSAEPQLESALTNGDIDALSMLSA